MEQVRVAMWSGPRNISTAMMRSWGNRDDTAVCDEPLYAHYCAEVRPDHPGVDDVIAHHETDVRKVIAWLTGPVPDGCRIFYQKHMAHHLLPEIERDWLEHVTNAFLIRDPGEMLTSLLRVMAAPTVNDTGLAQQVEIFEAVRGRAATPPPVIDARDVLEQPEGTLRRLCQALDVPFTDRMLSWPAGRRPTDGVWADHWYGQVESSTGFRPYRPKDEPVPEDFTELHDECRRLYEVMSHHRLTA